MKKLGILILLLLLVPKLLFAQASIGVSPDDRVYRAIDSLVGVGVVDKIIVGQRPYTRDEIARILIEAEKNFDRLENPRDKMMVFRILKYWDNIYSYEISVYKEKSPGSFQIKPLRRLQFNYNYLDGPIRLIFDNGLGTVPAKIRPLTEYMEGPVYGEGHNWAIDTHHSIRAPYFAFFAHPKFQFQAPNDQREPRNYIYVKELYAKAGIGNFEFEAGRDQNVWGQGENGGLFFSTNARALDYVKISNPHPFQLPWIFKYLGNFKGSIFLANMGKHYTYQYAYLSSWKLSLQPAKFAELGFSYGFITGGTGSPKLSAGSAAREFFGFIPGVGKPGEELSNKMGGMDFRFRIPSASSLEIYGELFFENPDLSHVERMFTQRAAYFGGLYLPRIAGITNMGLRFEYKHTSPYIYRFRNWTSGFSLGQELVGDPLGPDAQGVYASYYYDMGMVSRFIASFAYERRKGDTYRDNNGDFQKNRNWPTEERFRGTLSLEHPLKSLWFKWFFGYEAATNYNFVANQDRNSVIGGFRVYVDF